MTTVLSLEVYGTTCRTGRMASGVPVMGKSEPPVSRPSASPAGSAARYATWLISDGVPVNIVQKLLGHSRASVTLDRYTHEATDYFEQVRQALETVRMRVGRMSNSQDGR